jgi:hypothetical protein
VEVRDEIGAVGSGSGQQADGLVAADHVADIGEAV